MAVCVADVQRTIWPYRDAVLGSAPAGYWRLGEIAWSSAADELGARPGSYSGGVMLGTAGALAYRDEFTIALTDASGAYRAFPAHQVTFTVDDPLQAHAEQLGKYTDDDMHNVLAYLQTLR